MIAMVNPGQVEEILPFPSRSKADLGDRPSRVVHHVAGLARESGGPLRGFRPPWPDALGGFGGTSPLAAVSGRAVFTGWRSIGISHGRPR